MDDFERQFEHLDVQTQTMDEAMSGVTTLSVPEVRSLSDLTVMLSTFVGFANGVNFGSILLKMKYHTR